MNGSTDMTVLERELPRRVVVVGDLNGQGELLVRLLKGLRLIKGNGDWRGGRTCLVQIGDIPNRGSGARSAMDLMLSLQSQAREAGGDAIWLLGNHEVLSVLKHEAYVTTDEYLEFATEAEIEAFYVGRSTQIQRMLLLARGRHVIEPIGGPMRAWEEANAPGKQAYRKAMGRLGRYGRAIRQLPVAVRMGGLVFVHGGLSPEWAFEGIEGLQRCAEAAWGARPEFYEDLDPMGVLRDSHGPLWHREYCFSEGAHARRRLRDALAALGGEQMVVGHTRTDAVNPDCDGRPLARFGGRMIMSDVGLGDAGYSPNVLVIERGRIEAWSPGGARSRIADVKRPGRQPRKGR